VLAYGAMAYRASRPRRHKEIIIRILRSPEIPLASLAAARVCERAPREVCGTGIITIYWASANLLEQRRTKAVALVVEGPRYEPPDRERQHH
jgi:hypothetical protein